MPPNISTPDEMDRASFGLIYRGPALEDISIHLSDLGPSPLALSALLNEESSTLRPDQPRIDLKLRARRPGSFIAELEVVMAAAIRRALAPVLIKENSTSMAAIAIIVIGEECN